MTEDAHAAAAGVCVRRLRDVRNLRRGEGRRAEVVRITEDLRAAGRTRRE